MISFILISCASPQKRFDRLIRKNPTLLETAVDTIEYYDTIPVMFKGVELSTTIDAELDSTYFFKKEHFYIAFTPYLDTNKQLKIDLTGGCDTVYQNIPYHVQIPFKQLVYKPRDRLIPFAFGFMTAFTLLFVLFMLFIRRKPKE